MNRHVLEVIQWLFERIAPEVAQSFVEDFIREMGWVESFQQICLVIFCIVIAFVLVNFVKGLF